MKRIILLASILVLSLTSCTETKVKEVPPIVSMIGAVGKYDTVLTVNGEEGDKYVFDYSTKVYVAHVDKNQWVNTKESSTTLTWIMFLLLILLIFLFFIID